MHHELKWTFPVALNEKVINGILFQQTLRTVIAISHSTDLQNVCHLCPCRVFFVCLFVLQINFKILFLNASQHSTVTFFPHHDAALLPFKFKYFNYLKRRSCATVCESTVFPSYIFFSPFKAMRATHLHFCI